LRAPTRSGNEKTKQSAIKDHIFVRKHHGPVIIKELGQSIKSLKETFSIGINIEQY
jgi:hypothetical protein